MLFLILKFSGNKYKFQEQERQEELGLNWDSFKWRNYDYAIGRFMSIDPLAEKFPNWNPYNYCMKNPIMLTDPTGMSPEGDPVNPPKDAKEGQTHSEHRDSTTFNYAYECGSWTETEAIIVTVPITGNVKNASGVSDDSLWRYAPIVGSGLDSYDAYSRGEYWKGTAYLALAVSDVFLVKSLAVGGAKFAERSYAKVGINAVDDIAAKNLVNLTSKAVLKGSHYKVNGFKFSKYYYEKLWSTGRGAPSLVAKEVLEGGAKNAVPDAFKAGFNKYIYGGWEMIFNPATKEVWHLQPIR